LLRLKRLSLLPVACALALFLTGPVQAAEPEEPGVKYTMDVSGAPNGTVSRLIKQTSQLEELRKKLPATRAALARRIEGDEDRFRAVLESEGFYGGKVLSETEPQGDSIHVHIILDPGPQYTVASLRFDYGDRSEAVAALSEKASPETIAAAMAGKPARAAEVIKAEDAALDTLHRHGFPFAARGDRQVTVDHVAQTVAVVLPIAVGRKARFGAARFKGEKRLKPAYLQRLVPWKTGETFDTGTLDRFRQSLVRTTLFSSVKINPVTTEQTAPEDAPLDVDVAIAEGPAHTISVNGNFARDTGIGGAVSWEHRNLFGNAEDLNLSLDANKLAQTAKATLTKPNWKRLDQTLSFSTILQRSETDAFNGLSATAQSAIERRISTHWTIGAGLTTEVGRFTQNGILHHALIGGVPLKVTRYVSDDITERAVIDANHGWRFAATVTPSGGKYDGSVLFVKTELEGEVYLPLNALRTTVFAARLKVGSIAGSGTRKIPADQRFYSGGGGSVRGYGYQLISPRDADGTPLGGRSQIETNLEARFRLTRTIGVVPFIDAGSVADGSIPGQNLSMRVAAGLGLRYYTSVGPLRVDFATPLNKRPGDNSFQFYISFGQAF
jgi:translocation and assembly module TamA